MDVGIHLQLLYCFTLKGNVLNCQYLRNGGCLGFCESCFRNIVEDRVEITQEPENRKKCCSVLSSGHDITVVLVNS